MNEQQAAEIIRSMRGEAPGELVGFSPPEGGNASDCFRFKMGGQRFLLKVNKQPGMPVGLYFYRRLKEVGLPVPELVAFSAHAGPDGQAAAIWTWLDGSPAAWGPGEPCPYDEAKLGELLQRIHALPFHGAYGTLGDDLSARTFATHPDLGPVSQTWLGFFHWDRAAGRYRQMGYLDDGEARALVELPSRMQSFFAAVKPRLLHHGDIMHNGNLLVGPGRRITAILDFSDAVAGDPRWELTWFDYYFSIFPFDKPSFRMDRFRRAYGTDHDPDDEIGRFYLLAILLFEKLLFYPPASPRGRWAIRTVKEILRSDK